MKIAQVAPLTESVPPRYYGGTERIVAYLTEALVDAEHEVTLFASGDSRTRANLVPGCPRALRLEGVSDQLAWHLCMLEQVFERADEFDLIHFHVHYLHFPSTRRQPIANVTTLHGRLDLPELQPLHRQFADMPMVSISDAQRSPLPWLNWRGTIHHGLPLNLYEFQPKPDGYLAFIGRLAAEKRPDRAIEIARRAGLKLKIAAKIDPQDRSYFEQTVKPLLSQPHVEYIGEIGEEDKSAFLGGARALLFPIDWPEPFGLAMIEALACGTPVVAFRGGSVAEIVRDGICGFVCDDIDQAVAAVGRVTELSRRRCREEFEQRFSVARMAADYVRIYQGLIEEHHGYEREAARRGRSGKQVHDSRHLSTGG
jgi:glycosyltransferase involved in cell wall biosynthesis